MNCSWYSYGYQNSKVRVDTLVEIVKVQCPRCQRHFRTVPSVVDRSGPVYCPECGAHMKVSDPQPVSSLSPSSKANAA